MNTAGLFPTVYVALRRDCDLVRRRLATWTVVADDALFSVDAAWQHEVDVARACRQPRPDPAKYVIVSGAMKPDVDRRGAHLVIADWQHTYDPQSFYEEVVRERRMAEEGK